MRRDGESGVSGRKGLPRCLESFGELWALDIIGKV